MKKSLPVTMFVKSIEEKKNTIRLIIDFPNRNDYKDFFKKQVETMLACRWGDVKHNVIIKGLDLTWNE
jgi:hypothetical protein